MKKETTSTTLVLAKVTAEITSSHYQKSSLLQGGMEVRCKVQVAMYNHMLLDRYKELVGKLLC